MTSREDRWLSSPGSTRRPSRAKSSSAAPRPASCPGGARAPPPAETAAPPAAREAAPPDVETLFPPASGPWTKVGEAADCVRDIAPKHLIQIHETMLGQIGQQSMTRFISPQMLTEVPLTIVAAADTITV